MTLLAEHNGAAVHCCDWRELLPVVEAAGGCDLLCVDAPYSERTHAGHDDGTAQANRQRAPHICADGATRQIAKRHAISYSAWSAIDVGEFVGAWLPHVRGWFVTITDHVLTPHWADALEARGRYVFAPLPYVAPGSRVRLAGDGPSNWTTWIVVARPRTSEAAKWGTLPGAYILPPGHGGALPVVGGKPVWLLSELVSAYSRPNDLICDPCAGAGTLAVAAIRTGRRAIVGDVLREHADLAALWVQHPHRPAPSIERVDVGAAQQALFGGAR